MVRNFLWHDAPFRDDNGLVCRASFCCQSAFLEHCGQEEIVTNIVTIKPHVVNLVDCTYEIRSFLVHGVDIEHHKPIIRVIAPHITYGKVDKEIIVGLSPLEICLASCYIRHQFGSVPPDAISRTHIDRGIEAPSRPWLVLW